MVARLLLPVVALLVVHCVCEATALDGDRAARGILHERKSNLKQKIEANPAGNSELPQESDSEKERLIEQEVQRRLKLRLEREKKESARANRPVADKWALIVGVSRFRDPKLDLASAAKDAQDFYNYLVSEANFQQDHIVLLKDEEATRANILSALGDKWLPRLANPDDLVILYFSTHGSPSNVDVGGVNYLIAHDTDTGELFASGVQMQNLIRIIKSRIHCDRVVLFMDACHSGAADPKSKGLVRGSNIDVQSIAQGTGQLVISSSAPDQRSWELKDETNGVFTRYLIDGLRRNGAWTRLGDAFDYLEENVRQKVLRERGALQTPVLRSRWRGNDLLIAVKPVKPRPGMTFALKKDERESLASAAIPDLKGSKGALKVPAIWQVLERNTWGVLRGTWIYDERSNTFQADYDNGNTAKINLIKFAKDEVLLEGRFKKRSLAAPRGQQYRFKGVLRDNKIYGTVTYKHLGFRVKGNWEVTFSTR